MLNLLDGFLLSKVECFSHWTQRTFGIASLEWQRFFLLLAALSSLANYVLPDLQDWKIGQLALGGFVFFTIMLRLLAAGMMARSSSAMNPHKLDPIRKWMMALTLLFAPLDVFYGNALWFEYITAAEYFRACDDLPPGTSRVRQLLRSLSEPRLVPLEQS